MAKLQRNPRNRREKRFQNRLRCRRERVPAKGQNRRLTLVHGTLVGPYRKAILTMASTIAGSRVNASRRALRVFRTFRKWSGLLSRLWRDYERLTKSRQVQVGGLVHKQPRTARHLVAAVAGVSMNTRASITDDQYDPSTGTVYASRTARVGFGASAGGFSLRAGPVGVVFGRHGAGLRAGPLSVGYGKGGLHGGISYGGLSARVSQRELSVSLGAGYGPVRARFARAAFRYDLSRVHVSALGSSFTWRAKSSYVVPGLTPVAAIGRSLTKRAPFIGRAFSKTLGALGDAISVIKAPKETIKRKVIQYAKGKLANGICNLVDCGIKVASAIIVSWCCGKKRAAERLRRLTLKSLIPTSFSRFGAEAKRSRSRRLRAWRIVRRIASGLAAKANETDTKSSLAPGMGGSSILPGWRRAGSAVSSEAGPRIETYMLFGGGDAR